MNPAFPEFFFKGLLFNSIGVSIFMFLLLFAILHNAFLIFGRLQLLSIKIANQILRQQDKFKKNE
ncbi:hypothetical protein DHD08_06905 [Arenibacter sp. H213]|nr:hypothetical protein [Arenibacter sp. H213]